MRGKLDLRSHLYYGHPTTRSTFRLCGSPTPAARPELHENRGSQHSTSNICAGARKMTRAHSPSLIAPYMRNWPDTSPAVITILGPKPAKSPRRPAFCARTRRRCGMEPSGPWPLLICESSVSAGWVRSSYGAHGHRSALAQPRNPASPTSGPITKGRVPAAREGGKARQGRGWRLVDKDVLG